MDPLHDPDDDALLHPRQARELAGLVENARLASGAVRYGRIGRVGAATVVLNQDNPLPTANHACGLWGTLAEVATTLLALEQSFADAGRSEAVVYASPTTVGEIEGIADDSGWRAVEENMALLHRSRRTPTSPVRPATDDDLHGIAELIADDAGLSDSGERRLVRTLAHRGDDPRCVLRVLDDPEADRLAGFAQGFVEHGVGLVEHAVVRPGRRRRGAGSSLVADVVDELYAKGARLIAAHSDEGGPAERFAETCGFEPVYPVTAYARRVDELLD
ncbi:GNAT family N-acetyltransferase [Saccharopolyspora sp. NFXS83]|uniref:GNAT family N-acetyltransferase n=1 Tax=Saccharopolyspora sp. NFXS83 TaxID=2993560 RepID=UPI00224B4544|nr:GNAT family N-acetyltransferase [Saccharopolyspora sp. NFXS83]MCX2731035.1 GNAT family N-acetyltransferase [Saccharopolyspora sp. NFXS83]